jgi:hypothetical protein
MADDIGLANFFAQRLPGFISQLFFHLSVYNVAFLIAPVRPRKPVGGPPLALRAGGHLCVFPEVPEDAFLRLTAEYGQSKSYRTK